MALSPSVTVREFDLSLYAQQLVSTVLGVVGIFTKGPMDTPTFITNEAQLTDVFGPPKTSAFAWYACREYLRQANQVWVVRVGGISQAAGWVDILDIANNPSVRFVALTNGTHASKIQLVTTDNLNGGIDIALNWITPSGIAQNVERYYGVTRANVESKVNGISSYVTAVLIANPGEPVGGQTVVLQNGNDGDTGGSDIEQAILGSISGSTRTGLKVFEDPDAIDITLLAAPGQFLGTIQNEIIRICEGRRDCIGILDTPPSHDPEEAVQYHNGAGAWTGQHAAFNSSFAAMYHSWIRVNDEFNGVQLLVPPSCFALATIARTDRTTEPWFAPAGYRRGIANTALGLEVSPTQGQRDLMYSGGNAVNMFVQDARYGIVLLGQRTLQRTASALDRVNVRRMLCLVEKLVAVSSKPFLMQPLTARTQREWVGVIDPVLRDIVSKEGMVEYRLVMDETTNTALSADRSELRGKVYVKPVKAAEFIYVDFVVTSQGANFQELTVAA